jgi:hypothetical protein
LHEYRTRIARSHTVLVIRKPPSCNLPTIFFM